MKGWAEGAIGAIHIPDIGPLSATVAGLVGTVAGIGAAVAALTSEFESCAVTTCEGPNNLQGLLQTLLGLTSIAAFGAFLEQAISDPSDAVSEYEGQLSSVVSGIVTGGGDIWSAIESALGI